ncbi:hypothetical protein [Arthrobacter sp. KBS0702]|uniref:hypothetical protein n=1 Tax=Arthrobacter sp. KBS0702 TaxID=2578107 RepID=UPI0021BD6E7D|nr:hypothetical protein [Arthrobacter sp. KBS0702]
MSIFFWIIILSLLIPAAMRYYRRSVQNKSQGQDPYQGTPGGFPGMFPGQGPGQQSNQPRDGFTQRDYYGGFGQLGAPQPPANQQYPVPYEDSPDYLKNPPQAGSPQQWQPQPAAAPDVPPVPPVPSGPQGYRARKLAELDQKYSNGELAMEDYMAQRAEIMKG